MKTIFFIFLTFILTSCAIYDERLTLRDVSTTQEIILKSNKGTHVHSATFEVTGNINGNAELALMSDGKPYKTEKIKGKVDVRWVGDWYSDQATIIYTTTNVTEGKLVFKYKFNTI